MLEIKNKNLKTSQKKDLAKKQNSSEILNNRGKNLSGWAQQYSQEDRKESVNSEPLC